MFKKVSEGCYINFDHILEIRISTNYSNDESIDGYEIVYWTERGDENQIPGTFKTEKEAIEALNYLMLSEEVKDLFKDINNLIRKISFESNERVKKNVRKG